MRRKDLYDCLLFILVFCLPFAGILMTAHLGTLSLMTVIPAAFYGAVIVGRRRLHGPFFFEKWLPHHQNHARA